MPILDFSDHEHYALIDHPQVLLPHDHDRVILHGPFKGQDVDRVYEAICVAHLLAGRAVNRTLVQLSPSWRMFQSTEAILISVSSHWGGTPEQS